MAANEEKHCIALGRIEIQTLQGGLRDLNARSNMALAGRALANVMQEQGQIEKLGPFQLRKQLRIALIPLRLRLLQAMQAFDGNKRVLVDREAMIVVAHHQG